MQTLDLDILAAFKLLQDLAWWWVGVQVAFKLAQFSLPLTPVFLIRAANSERIERPSQSLIFECIEILGFAAGAWSAIGLYFLDTRFAEAVATAGGLVGVSENGKTDGTLRLDGLRWRVDKLAVVEPSHVSTIACTM